MHEEQHREHHRAAPRVALVALGAGALVLSSLVGAAAGYVAGGWCSGAPGVAQLQQRLALEPACAVLRTASDGTTEIVPTTPEEQARIATVKAASPAVVSIVVGKDVPRIEQYYYNPFGDGFFDGPQFQIPGYRQNGTEHREVGAGSGFLVSADGYILTNRHVVSDTSADYTVILQDGRQLPAKVLARDPSNDIAVLKVEGTDFPALSPGDSDKIEVGQSAIAIGYALGRFGNTVSTGVISGVGRSIEAGDASGASEELFNVLQTDAAINPGNSGGPLLNLKGEVIGMSVAIVQGSQNIGFALPINDVRAVYESVRETGRVVRPFLGIRYQMITPELKKSNQLPVDHGALIVRGDTRTDLAVIPGSPADKAGIVENDIILEIGGRKVDEDHPVSVLLRRYKPGDKVPVKILQKGQEKIVEVTLEEKK